MCVGGGGGGAFMCVFLHVLCRGGLRLVTVVVSAC